MDAFVIRGTLVPAFMRLAGEANWWAPGPMRRFYERFGISEHVDLDEPHDAPVVPAAEVADGSDVVVIDDTDGTDDAGERRANGGPAVRPNGRRTRPLVAAGRDKMGG